MLLASPVMSAPLSFSDILTQFNLVVFEDAKNSSEVEGRTFVGGDLTGISNYWIGGAYGSQAPSAYAAITVGGDLTGWANVNNGGTVVVGGNASQVNLNGGGSAKVGGTATQVQGGPAQAGLSGTAGFDALFPTEIEAVSTAASLSFAGLMGTAPTISGSKGSFGSGIAGLTVYNLTLAQFAALGEMDFSGIALGEQVLINVTGSGSAYFGANPLGGKGGAEHVLWNFTEATNLTLQGIIGSVLAPLAHVTVTNPVEGTLIARSATLNSEIHLRPYAHAVPNDEQGPPAPVPLPAALPLLLAGMGAMGALAIRRRR